MKVLWVMLGAFLLSACTSQLQSPIQSGEELIVVDSTPTLPTVGETTPTPFPLFTLSTLSPTPTAAITPTPLESTALTPTVTTPPLYLLCSPLEGYTFSELKEIESQAFIPPHPGKDDGHHGVDFAHWQYKDRGSLEGAGVQSALSGVVAASIPEKYPYGNMIIIESVYASLSPEVIENFQIQPDQSLYLLYAHLKTPATWQIGEEVECGELVGEVGNTGASGNPHLHLETRVGSTGITFASMEYYKTTSTDEERANYESWRFNGDFILFDPWLLLALGE